MFLHIENQSLLWKSLQKSPYLVEFQQKYASHRENWFRGAIEQFYAQWIGAGAAIPQTSKALLEMNKHALQFMVLDLKRLLGYKASSDNVNAPLMSYDVAAEKKQREDKWSAEFSQYQAEYNRMLSNPVLPRNVLPSEMTDERITNMDELLAEHAKRREYDISSIAASFPPPPSASNLSSQTDKIEFVLEPTPSATLGAPRLRILDELPHPPNAKSVSWSEHLEVHPGEQTNFQAYS